MSLRNLRHRSVVGLALLAGAFAVYAADVTVEPAAGSGFVVKNGASEYLRAQASGITLAGVPDATTQSNSLCFSDAGLLGPCGGTSGGTTLPAGTENQTLRYDGTNAPAPNNLLLATGDGGLVATGTGSTGTIPATGAGVRMMWYPAKAAFRVGYVDGAQWDDANVGGNSIAMGYNTTAKGNASFAMGVNTTASISGSVAMGRSTTASGISSTAMGSFTTASGSYSTAMGRDASTTDAGNASIVYDGSFVYGDGSATTNSTALGQFMVRASGGFVFYTAWDKTTGVYLNPGSGSWMNLSDRDSKTAIVPIDALAVLDKVVALPLNTWQYKMQDEKYRHMGPMAQDFHAAFKLGETDKGIDDIDAQGVALAAIQGLNTKLEEKVATQDAEIAALHARFAAQEWQLAQLQTLTAEVAALKVAFAQRPSARTVALTEVQP